MTGFMLLRRRFNRVFGAEGKECSTPEHMYRDDEGGKQKGRGRRCRMRLVCRQLTSQPWLFQFKLAMKSFVQVRARALIGPPLPFGAYRCYCVRARCSCEPGRQTGTRNETWLAHHVGQTYNSIQSNLPRFRPDESRAARAWRIGQETWLVSAATMVPIIPFSHPETYLF